MEITIREAIVSVGIIALFIFLGVWISSSAFSDDRLVAYETAHVLTTESLYQHATKTNLNNTLSYGELAAVHPVSDDMIDGQYMAIDRVEEHYTMKTRMVSYSCGKDNKDTCWTTEIYWEWDVVASVNTATDEVMFLGSTLPYERVSSLSKHHHSTVEGGDHQRFEFYVLETSLMTSIYESSMGDDLALYPHTEPQAVIDNIEGSLRDGRIKMWIALTIITIETILVFFYADNHWLES